MFTFNEVMLRSAIVYLFLDILLVNNKTTTQHTGRGSLCVFMFDCYYSKPQPWS